MTRGPADPAHTLGWSPCSLGKWARQPPSTGSRSGSWRSPSLASDLSLSCPHLHVGVWLVAWLAIHKADSLASNFAPSSFMLVTRHLVGSVG